VDSPYVGDIEIMPGDTDVADEAASVDTGFFSDMSQSIGKHLSTIGDDATSVSSESFRSLGRSSARWFSRFCYDLTSSAFI